MVQTEGDQRTLDAAVDKGSEVAGRDNDAAQRVDSGLDDRPYKVADDTGQDTEDHADDRDKTRAAEEGQRVRNLLLIEFVGQKRSHDTGDDTAEHTHLQGGDAEHRSDGAVLHCRGDASVRKDLTADLQTDVHGGEHDQIEDACAEDCDASFLFRHTHGDCQREDQRQVSEHRAACAVEQHHQGIERRAFMKDTLQMIGRDRRRIGKGTTETQQNTCRREDSDRKEQ